MIRFRVLLVCAIVLLAACDGISPEESTPTATPRVQVSPTPGPTETPENIIWAASHAAGDMSEWRLGQKEAVFNSGSASVELSDDVVRSGPYSLKMTIETGDGQGHGARIFRTDGNPTEGYYSAWVYFPRPYWPDNWWNIFQFKSKDPDASGSDPTWTLNVRTDSQGNMDLYWYAESMGGRTYRTPLKPVTLPVRRWVHIEVYYKAAADNTGHVILWQDGVKLYDIKDVRTLLREGDELHWSLNNYSDDIDPPTATIYWDDAVISTTRVGPQGLTAGSESREDSERSP